MFGIFHDFWKKNQKFLAESSKDVNHSGHILSFLTSNKPNELE
jgi:hypothetical protein